MVGIRMIELVGSADSCFFCDVIYLGMAAVCVCVCEAEQKQRAAVTLV